MLEKEDKDDLYSDMTILCVDDEARTLRALQRLFHRKTYQVLVAKNALHALLLLQKHSVNLIISDMRIPEMDGVPLLQQAAQFHPETYRIILSGYANFESTVDAINLEKIHNFINKPWSNNELISAVKEGLETVRLKQENKRLRTIIGKQNAQLKLWNNELEDKINLRTKQIRNILKNSEINIKHSEIMLFNLIATTPNLSGDFAKNVGNLAGRLADKVGLDKYVVNEIRLAGFLTEIGMLALDPLICTTPFNLLNREQQKKFLSQGLTAKQILSPAQHMKNVSDMIVNQYQPINELSLPETLTMGIKILAVARDYWRYASRRILPEHLDHIHICIEMNKEKGIKYAEEILKVLLSHPELIDDNTLERGLTTRELKPGMLLKYNLYNINQLLILTEGHEFSEYSIDNLIEYEKKQKHILSIVTEVSNVNN